MIEQGTEEWFAARCGLVTASKMEVVMSKGRGNAPSATRANYMAQLAAERLTGVVAEGFTNSAMEWGNEHEAQARALYALETGLTVTEAPFVLHPDIKEAGASPDGYAGKDGLVEIKCPNTATHIATLQGASIKRGYILQMQWQMACTGREWCDFVSFDPRMPDILQMKIQRVERDDDMIEEMRSQTVWFLLELGDMVESLRGMMAA